MSPRSRGLLSLIIGLTASAIVFASPTVEEIIGAYAQHQDRILHFTDRYRFEESLDVRYTIPRFDKSKQTT